MIAKFQYVTGNLPYDQVLYNIRDFCRAGGQWVQLRVKDVSPGKFLEIAQKAKRICNQYNTKLIINDDPHIARAVNAHGVHLGQEDMAPSDARILLFPHQIIGSTCNTIEDIEKIINDGKSNYIGLGPIFKTSTKQKVAPEIGIKGTQKIMDEVFQRKLSLPIIAIGGIEVENLEQIFKTRVDGIAFSSMFEKNEDKKGLIKKIIQITENELDNAKFEISR